MVCTMLFPRSQEGSGNPEVQDYCDLDQSHPKPTAVHNDRHIREQQMNTLTPTTTRNPLKRAFTLIEILIVVVILGILAAVVVPQFTNAADDANDAAVRTQLQTLRGQIELFRAQNSADPNLLTTGWEDMIEGNYLMSAPTNPLASSSTIEAAAEVGAGWVWRDKSDTNATKGLYATDGGDAEFSE